MEKTMNTYLRTVFAIASIAIPILYATPAHAQATRTWVSGVGDDANPCSRTAPCKTFAGAISKTAMNGEINCLDPGGFGGVTITKSITIDCHEIYASVLVAGTNGINIAFDSFAVGDTRKTVRLRNLNFNGANTGLKGISITGVTNTAGSEVHVEDCMIDGFFGSPGIGIADTRANGGKLFIANTTIRNNLGSGVTIAPSSGATRIDATLTNVHSKNNAFGVAVGSGARVMIKQSTLSGNTNGGVESEGTAPEVNVNDSVISNNGLGFQQIAGTIRFSNNDVAFNTTLGSGTVNSFSNNRFSGNGVGGTISAIAPAGTNPSGQQ
jgi:hypothetical protein